MTRGSKRWRLASRNGTIGCRICNRDAEEQWRASKRRLQARRLALDLREQLAAR